MNRVFWSKLALLAILGGAFAPYALADGETAPARDPKQPVDAAYTEKIHKVRNLGSATGDGRAKKKWLPRDSPGESPARDFPLRR